MAKRRGHGEDSIYQLPDGRWRASVSLGWRESKGGQPIWTEIVIGKTRFEVQEELKKLLRDQHRRINIDPEKQATQSFLSVGWSRWRSRGCARRPTRATTGS